MSHWILHLLDPLQTVCNEWCLHFWEVAGVWFTGAATFAAVIVSLRLARRQSMPQLRVSASKRIYVSGVATGTPSISLSDFPDMIVVEAVNTGMVPVKITSVFWTMRGPQPLRWLGLRRTGGFIQNAPEAGQRSHVLPASVGSTEVLQWILPLD